MVPFVETRNFAIIHFKIMTENYFNLAKMEQLVPKQARETSEYCMSLTKTTT